ncbi:2-oxoglutarate dehydrogenase E1 subunit family protein [Georgenia sp. SUBG003]|uniref:2-oxoglutarate dehydrogenase E1 subunit family protein n=1 Tax=Georgenia sp. SUBG003 TaxID=1497974 RepID=UPI003AB294D7
MAAFGANEWLIEELYEKYRQNKQSVDPAWWDFFEGYEGRTANGSGHAPAPAATGARQATEAEEKAPAAGTSAARSRRPPPARGWR